MGDALAYNVYAVRSRNEKSRIVNRVKLFNRRAGAAWRDIQ